VAEIILKQISKQFEQRPVIRDLNLTIRDGSFTILLGPSGCGKTTTLRMIAGLEVQDRGELWIGDGRVDQVPPGERDVAMVFQNYALYPTMTVRENIEFGLINKKVPKRERRLLVEEITETVGLKDYLNKKPGVLSGGQRQRVALARAMIKKPRVFLMDEPLSNLDAKLRTHMRTELVELHRKLGTTFVYVTHDQTEAMSMGEEIVVMNQGKIIQAGNPLHVYNNPDNVFTAQFIGTPPMNVVERGSAAHLLSVNRGAEVAYIGFRPEKVVTTIRQEDDGLKLSGLIVTRQILGAETVYQFQTEIGTIFARDFSTSLLDISSAMELFIAYRDLHFFDRQGNRIKEAANDLADEGICVRKGVAAHAMGT
jgi:sn-glycerol 3-phosphate transport system ATP-binding protein